MTQITILERKSIYELCKRLKKDYGFKIVKKSKIWFNDNYSKVLNQKNISRQLLKNNIKVLFLESDIEGEPVQIYADNIKCWVKPNRCSVILPLPRNEKQFQFLINQLNYIDTPEGFVWATSYDSKFIYKYPLEIC